MQKIQKCEIVSKNAQRYLMKNAKKEEEIDNIDVIKRAKFDSCKLNYNSLRKQFNI